MTSAWDDEWRDIEDFPGWAVSRSGNILNDATNRVLRVRTNQQGIVMVGLWREGKQHMRSVPLIVAKAFLEPPANPSYNSIIHLDGNKENCAADNLMWRPRWYAIRYHQMFDKEPYRVSVYLTDTDETFETLRDACVKYGLIEHNTYVDMINNNPCFHYQFIFKQARD